MEGTVEKDNKKHFFVSLCSGGGGLDTGLVQSGLIPIFLNDIDKNCCDTLKLNHPKTKVIQGSFVDLNLDNLVGLVDVMISGPPCQAFSVIGNRGGLNDERGNLLLEFIKVIFKLRPKIFMIENVKGLTNINGGDTFRHILELLNKDNLYDVKYKLLNAVDYEVPQKRERIFIVGVLKSLNKIFEFPEKSDKKLVLKDVLIDCPMDLCAKYSDEKIKLFKMIPQGGCWVDLPEDLQKQYMGESFYSGGGKRGILRRLSMEEPSLTILCTPSQKQSERCFPTEERPLSIRETARIQTFPDDYQFCGSLLNQYKIIGNSVPVALARKMGEQIIKCLNG